MSHNWCIYLKTARLMFKGVEVPEHSLVVREAIGTDNANTLKCVSDYRPCCTNSDNLWRFDDGGGLGYNVPTIAHGGFYQNRNTGVV